MTAKDHEKRRMRLLADLARQAKGRHDVKLSLSEVAPSLEMEGRNENTTFVEAENADHRGRQDLSFDLTTLCEDGLLEGTFLEDGPVMSDFDLGPKEPAITVTRAGLRAVEEFHKSWLAKAIEKQPMTFLHVVATIVIAVLSFVGGLVLGRFTAPDGDHTSSSSPTESVTPLPDHRTTTD